MVIGERPWRNPRPLCVFAWGGWCGQIDASAEVVSTEPFPAMVVDEASPRKRWGSRPTSQQPPMFKSFLALAAMTLLGASVIALPAFAPKVEAAETSVLAKADRLQV